MADGGPPSSSLVSWPLLSSPITGYPYTQGFGLSVFMTDSLSPSKLQHAASVLAAWVDNDQVSVSHSQETRVCLLL